MTTDHARRPHYLRWPDCGWLTERSYTFLPFESFIAGMKAALEECLKDHHTLLGARAVSADRNGRFGVQAERSKTRAGGFAQAECFLASRKEYLDKETGNGKPLI